MLLGKANLFALDDDAMKLHYFISKEGTPITELINYSYLDSGENYSNAGRKIPTDQQNLTKSGISEEGWVPKDAVRRIERYKGILNYFFSDCPDATRKVQYLKFDERDLMDIFTTYNSCGNSTIWYASNREKIGAEWNLFGGVSSIRSKYLYGESGLLAFSTHNVFTGGLELNLRMRYKYRFVNLVNSLQFSRFSTTSTASESSGPINIDYFYRVTSNIFSLNSSVKLVYPDKKLVPYITFGVRNSLVYLKDNFKDVTITQNGMPTTRRFIFLNGKRIYQLGLCLGSGIGFGRFYTELKYYPDFNIDLDGVVGTAFTYSSIDFNLGYKLSAK